MTGTPGPTYQFKEVVTCNMCGASPDAFKVLGVRLNCSQGRNPKQVRGIGVTIVRCTACRLVFPDPQPVPSTLLDHYSMSGEEYWNDSRVDAMPSQHMVDQFARLNQLLEGENRPIALDVGVGSGQAAKAMMIAGFEVHGFEPISQFREIALRTLGLPPDRITGDGIETAEFPGATFSLVNFGAVLEHLYDPNAALEKAVRWLKPGGLVVLEVPSSKWLIGRLINAFFRLRQVNYVTNVSPMHSPFHLYEFSERSFRLNGARLGYAVQSIDVVVGIDPSLPRLLQGLLRPIMRASRTGMQMHVLLRKR